ncbi:V0D/AC39 family V-type ATPase subunit [Candidatus Nitrosotenuis aquarius]|uniref:V0D/AC39 family V-type ATPase subunit n=1 Tax=Candidatus Nitrosotenuis aquarius TaxID=1846278 RepID=UPI000C1F250C|nr:V-type ATPase subunit [Candidatus Nitrosotenuis aquarius]
MVTQSLQVYAGVKSYSLKGKLLTKKDLQTLSESRDLDELVTRLKNTTYNDSISKVTKPFSAQKIELALRDRQAELHHMMMQASGGSNVMFAYYLKFILRNLKIILKGKILGRPQSEIETSLSLHPEELIKERDIVLKALVAKDIEEAVSVLKAIGIGEEVEKAYLLYNEKKQIQVLDLYFDKSFYENLSRTVKSSGEFTLHSVCGMEIDFYNMMSILRGKFWNLDENQLQHIIVSNASSEAKEILTRMISADSIKNALNELLGTHYKDLVPQDEDDVIAKFERSFERKIYDTMNAQFVRIFGFSTVVAIVRLLDYEIRNLSSIAFGVEQNIPSQTVMDRLIVKDA